VFATFTGLVVLGIADFGGGGELGDPGDVVRFLAAPETRWVTAQTVYGNGGMISPFN
jgi:hypothetical protein